ncbi:MAG TPA: hypothetical protein VNC59_04535 [Thermoanaerobaculia bacterium]|nr:hypothetical protein [Thermoanaerobaculia bacterium]
MMSSRIDDKPRWAYYGAIAVFLGILAFAVLGILRSSSLVGSTSALPRAPAPTPTRAPSGILAPGPPPAIRIPPRTASAATPPPSRTYIHPPPESEGLYSDPAAELRR